MALVLTMEWFPYKDITAIAVDDTTQERVDGDDGGWGVGGNPDRVDRCLVFWTKHIDSASNESYLTQLNSVQAADGAIAFADGFGLANTDKSRFKVTYGEGHLIFYMLPIVNEASEPAGVEGDLYFNSVQAVVYYHDGASFIALTSDLLTNIESAAGIKVEEYLFDLNKRVCLGSKTRELIFDPQSRNIEKLEKQVRELRNKTLVWWATFKEGKQPTARKLLKGVEDVC